MRVLSVCQRFNCVYYVSVRGHSDGIMSVRNKCEWRLSQKGYCMSVKGYSLDILLIMETTLSKLCGCQWPQWGYLVTSGASWGYYECPKSQWQSWTTVGVLYEHQIEMRILCEWQLSQKGYCMCQRLQMGNTVNHRTKLGVMWVSAVTVRVFFHISVQHECILMFQVTVIAFDLS